MYKNCNENNQKLGHYLKPYIIAEIGVNHEGSMDLAKQLIREAKEGGADAAKFQSYKAEKIASKNSPAYWDTTKESTTSQFELFKKYDSFQPSDYVELAKYCKELDIDFLSTPFDLEAVDFLKDLMSFFKIASADITNVPLIRKVAQTGKPIVMSTGAATIPEIEFAVQTAQHAGATDISLLHCVLNYPTALEDSHLGAIQTLSRIFPDLVIGYSDHTVPTENMDVLVTATLLGATILEKHFTHDKKLPGNDHYHAMDENDLRILKKNLKNVRISFGSFSKNLKGEESARLHARRSLVASKGLKKGDVLTECCLVAKRPGNGISPMFWDQVMGQELIKDVLEDVAIQWSDMK